MVLNGCQDLGLRLNNPSVNSKIDLSVVVSAVFLPLLVWTGAVIVVTFFGYPWIVNLTPLAWLLALPVGARVGRDSASRDHRLLLEAALGGGTLGLWQGLLFAAALVAGPYLPGWAHLPADMPAALAFSLGAACLGVLVTAGLAVMAARLVIRRKKSK